VPVPRIPRISRYSNIRSKSGHPLVFRVLSETEQGDGIAAKVSQPVSRARCRNKDVPEIRMHTRLSVRCRWKGESAGWRIVCQWRTRGERKSDLSKRTRARVRDCERVQEGAREIHELPVIRRPDQCRSVPRSARQVAPLRHSVHILGEGRSHMRTVIRRPSCVLGLRQGRKTCRSIHSTSRPPCPFSRHARISDGSARSSSHYIFTRS